MGFWKCSENDEIYIKGGNVVEGMSDWTLVKSDSDHFNFGVINEFLKDDDLVELTITSPSIGFTYTYQKRPNKDKEPKSEEDMQEPMMKYGISNRKNDDHLIKIYSQSEVDKAIRVAVKVAVNAAIESDSLRFKWYVCSTGSLIKGFNTKLELEEYVSKINTLNDYLVFYGQPLKVEVKNIVTVQSLSLDSSEKLS